MGVDFGGEVGFVDGELVLELSLHVILYTLVKNRYLLSFFIHIGLFLIQSIIHSLPFVVSKRQDSDEIIVNK